MAMKIVTHRLFRISFFCLCLVPGINSTAQNNRNFFPDANHNILTAESEPGFFHMKEDMGIQADEVFTTYKRTFGLSEHDDMRVIKSTVDPVGQTHIKYQQYFNNIPVETSMLIVHTRQNGNIYLVNGTTIHDLRLPVTPVIDEANALALALKEVPAIVYLWQDPKFENIKKETEHDPAATYYPKGKLCIYPMTRNEDLLTQDFSLGWLFDIYVGQGGSSTRVFVDAVDGKIKNQYPLGHECNSGTANTIYNGNQTIKTQLTGGTYKLIDDCQATIIHTYNFIGDSILSQATEFTDADNVWNATNQRSPAQSHFSAEQTYKYYLNAHSRTSWDGGTGQMSVYHGTRGISYANACWGCLGNVVSLGIGPTANDNDDWNTLDIVGHEFTHGVDQDEVGMPYYAQTGALDESYADIFGEMVEQTTEGWTAATSPWLVGEDRGVALRSFWNPNDGDQPDTYKGTDWFNVDTCFGQPAGDNCGVHTNSGVQNYWFYLLAAGGNGTNDNGEPFSVLGLGNTKARNIAYQNLLFYQTPTSKYLETRNGAIQAAEDLFGVCSNEAIQTAKAWFAVGADVEHLKYNAFLNCFNINSNASDVYIEGINSLRLSYTVCGIATATSTNHDIYFLASKYVGIKNDAVFKATGSSAIIIAPSECSYTVY